MVKVLKNFHEKISRAIQTWAKNRSTHRAGNLQPTGRRPPTVMGTHTSTSLLASTIFFWENSLHGPGDLWPSKVESFLFDPNFNFYSFYGPTAEVCQLTRMNSNMWFFTPLFLTKTTFKSTPKFIKLFTMIQPMEMNPFCKKNICSIYDLKTKIH